MVVEWTNGRLFQQEQNNNNKFLSTETFVAL